MSNPVTIIMIEDDEGHARLIERNIRRSGVNNEIIPFTSGTAALNYLFGKDGTGLDSGLDPYTFMQAAQFCGVAPGDPPFGQKNGQMVDHFKLTNSWWVKFGVVKENYPPEKGIDCSLLKDLYDSDYRG